jgi:hypothetical protein
MYSKEELSERYRKFEDNELLEIIYRTEDYTENAILAATDEVKRRGIKTVELENFYETRERDHKIEEATRSVPLTLREKVAWFFLLGLIPILNTGIRLNYRDFGLTKKIDQSRYYSTYGISALVVTAFLSLAGLNFFFGLLIWISAFWVAQHFQK